VAQAAKPGEMVAACAVAGVVCCCRFCATSSTSPTRKRPRVFMNALWERGEFPLARFDGRTLATLREAVEGPPLTALRAEAPAQPAVPRLPRREIPLTQRLTIAIAVASTGHMFTLGYCQLVNLG
jgi:hypothetical protein